MKHELARRKALADACAGVIGSLASMLIFYPVDVWKTNLQAGKHKTPIDENVDGKLATTCTEYESSIKQQMQSLPRLFRGLSYKIAHTTVSSFTYFFVYSLVQTKYFAYRQSQHGYNNKDKKRIPTVTKLSLAAFAAIINTSVTLPLDTLSSRMQTGHNEEEIIDREVDIANMEDGDGEKNDTTCNIDETNEHNTTKVNGRSRTQMYISSPEKFKFSFSTNLREEAFVSGPINNLEYNGKLRHRLQSILSLWNGLLPAILLCSNPAIQYTMYDTLKSWLLLHQPKQNQQTTAQKGLPMKESFIFGLISKFFATIATYPLIRAKVMLMVAPTNTSQAVGISTAHKISSQNSSLNAASATRESINCTDDNTSNNCTKSRLDQKHPNSLLLLLLHIFKKDGVGGLYRGCSLQLLHTVLKSAMLLMVRERITFATRHFFRVEDG